MDIPNLRIAIPMMAAGIAITALVLTAEPAAGDSDRYKVEQTERIRKSIEFESAAGRELVLDNVFGSISITGTGGSSLNLIAHKTIRARNQEKLERAQKEVSLEITNDGNAVELYVDGPFRCEDERGRGIRWRDPGYTVIYDFEIELPRGVDIYLKTINKGDISVSGIDGDFDVRNVNGKITIEDINGSGRAHTVNGRVKVMFSRNPREDCSFKTVNGDLDIRFRNGLSAEFRLKTFNGDMFSDFEIDYLPMERSEPARRKNGKYIYKSNRFVGVRTGRGGPQVRMDTLNGDILIRKQTV